MSARPLQRLDDHALMGGNGWDTVAVLRAAAWHQAQGRAAPLRDALDEAAPDDDEQRAFGSQLAAEALWRSGFTASSVGYPRVADWERAADWLESRIRSDPPAG